MNKYEIADAIEETEDLMMQSRFTIAGRQDQIMSNQILILKNQLDLNNTLRSMIKEAQLRGQHK